MDENRLLRLLGEGVAVCDGAMGTMLYERGVFVNRSFDELNLTQPDLVREVHAEYVAAGADVIETNTFSANRFKLAPHGLVDRLEAINREGLRIAREAAGNRARVAASIGPLGVRIEPWGPVSLAEARAAFQEQLEALDAAGGVDLVLLETFYHLPELEQAVRAARDVFPQTPLVAMVSVTQEGATPEGIPPESFGPTLADWGVDGVGVNCGAGPVATLEAIEGLAEAVELPLVAQPNAGQPRNIDGRNLYLSSPDYVASYARRFVKAGARLVGGCCGTTPEHIRAIRAAVAATRPAARPRPSARHPRPTVPPKPVPRREKSALAASLADGRFPVCVRVHAPRGCDPEPTLETVRSLAAGGAEEIIVPEVLGSGRMTPFALAQFVQERVGCEAAVEYSCRFRTLIRMQSELLGAYALGLKNVILVTGAAPSLGEAPDATANLEVDSIGLTNMVRRLNEGLDIGGRSLGRPTGFHIGVHLDPFAIDRAHEVRRFEWKVDAGAEFAVTPPVLDPEGLADFLGAVEHCRIPLLASVPLLASLRDAERLQRETGVGHLPSPLLERLRTADAKGNVAAAGFEIAREIADALRGLVEGVAIVTPEGEHARAARLAEALRETAHS
ncbi:MAG: bifunctional homocysteine S-methyltransferase/methylenetetrahydrofolate reductase [Planctomycetota bacterium]|nr:MAG: bifunctional homocysteine S-methyltransferase/methylenetetrahydrofolate reductase [Planctomycetota bacterium]